MERAGILHLGFLTRMKQSDRSEEHTSELQSPCNLVCRIIIAEKHTSELQSPCNLVCRLLLEKKKTSDIKKAADRDPPIIVTHHTLRFEPSYYQVNGGLANVPG